MGFSRGNQQMFYALAHNEDYLAPKIDKFISLSPCAFQGVSNVQNYDGFFSSLAEEDIFVIYGPDWSDKWNSLCKAYKEPCDTVGPTPSGQPISIKEYKHQSQLYFAKGFFEYIDSENYRQGDKGEPIPIGEIAKVPLYYIAGHEDKYCNYNLIYPKKFKDFSLPEAVKTFAYEGQAHQDMFKYPSIFKSALIEILAATSL